MILIKIVWNTAFGSTVEYDVLFNSVARSYAARMVASWALMVVRPLSVEFIGDRVDYGCRISCVEEDGGFGGPVWSGSVETSKEE